MVFYIARRLLWTLVVVFCVLGITYLVFYKLPQGDPALRFAGKNPTTRELTLIRHRLGLDLPWYQQFGKFSWHFFAGDQYGWPGLGFTFSGGGTTSVKSLVFARAPRTLLLIAGAAVLWLFSGVAIGVLSAVRRRSFADRFAMGFALFGISTPVFWLGLIMLYVFWAELGWAGGTGYVSPANSPTGFFSHMILPWITLAMLYAAFYARMTRNNLLETLGEDYIRTARAKGLSERQVIFKHGLRASLTPIVTMFGMDIALLVGGAVITETVFAIPGVGRLVIDSVQRHDYPVIQSVLLLSAGVYVLINLLIDLSYRLFDPRIRD
jgi:peptide/nickel transport system permease protein